MAVTIMLLSILLTGLVLLAIGIVLLIKVKNKLAGVIVTAVGLVFTLFSTALFLALTITTSVRG